MTDLTMLRETEESASFQRALVHAEESLQIYEKAHAIVGHAKCEHGGIRASYSIADGPVELALEPEALRLDPDDLAVEILEVMRSAILDAREQSRQVSSQLR